VLPGPQLTIAEQTECLLHLRRAAARARIVVASGSLPPGVPQDFYQQVATVCAELGTILLLDTSGGGLTHVKSGVFLLKPSIRELREDLGEDLTTEAEQVGAARGLVSRGVARHVLVSLGPQGALLVSRDGARRFAAVEVPPGSGVGAGDAMLAGVAVGIAREWPLSDAVRLGIAAGAAMMLTPGTAPCTREDTERLFRQTGKPVDVEA
jgi:6-phosphofructokinase 2